MTEKLGSGITQTSSSEDDDDVSTVHVASVAEDDHERFYSYDLIALVEAVNGLKEELCTHQVELKKNS